MKHLDIKWSTSRGRDTYGYNICSLISTTRDEADYWKQTVRRYRTCGGGYDMLGTVVGDWLAAEYQDRLMTLKERAHTYWDGITNATAKDHDGARTFYGMTWYFGAARGAERVVLDGGCGIREMEKIAEAIGLRLHPVVNRKGHVTAYMVGESVEQQSA